MARNRSFSKQTVALLSVLFEQPRKWRYGYDLARETGLKSGSLYPILMRLCDRDLLESKWEESPENGRPPRHMYRLTSVGKTAARELATARVDAHRIKAPLGSRA